MRELPQAEAQSGAGKPGMRTGSDLERRFPVALALYVVLAGLVWFTMDGGTVLVWGRPVDFRLVPLIIIGGLALRTLLAVQADKIRRGSEQQADSRTEQQDYVQ